VTFFGEEFMSTQKAFLLAVIVLISVSAAGADLNLTINGLDATKPLEIRGKDNLVIAIAGQDSDKAQEISVTCDAGKFESLTKPSKPAKEPALGKYLFTFTNESEVSTISLNVGKEIAYQLILFHIPETNTVIAFGVDKEALAPPQPKSEPEPEQQIFTSQTAEPQKSYFAGMSGGGTTEIESFPEPNSYPDLNSDKIVNFVDFAMFAENWQKSGTGLNGDFDKSEAVDINDLATFAYFWLSGPHPLNVFELFKAALLADDVNEAVSYFAQISAENYRSLLEQLRPYFTQMVNDMGEMIFIRFDTDMAVYDLLREENEEMYGYPVIFVRDEMGQWKIYDF
jgi:hypothetical protein